MGALHSRKSLARRPQLPPRRSRMGKNQALGQTQLTPPLFALLPQIITRAPVSRSTPLTHFVCRWTRMNGSGRKAGS